MVAGTLRSNINARIINTIANSHVLLVAVLILGIMAISINIYDIVTSLHSGISKDVSSRRIIQFSSAYIINTNLFGVANSSGDISDYEFNSDIAKMKLKGLVSSENSGANTAGAIIMYNNQEKIYRVGENLPINAILSQILKDRIVIKRGEISQTLFFAEEKG